MLRPYGRTGERENGPRATKGPGAVPGPFVVVRNGTYEMWRTRCGVRDVTYEM
ncbi:hypothetical protein [Streptomyces sp. NPDC005485]|uniref:hypothetical protein n=1 Tax=Streptomyces sp. NPDC005485 TaxID=3155591 RepID=UPI0033A68992